MRKFLLFIVAMLGMVTNMMADDATYHFTATDKNGKVVNDKLTSSPFTVKLAEYTEGMKFFVNGTESTYDATNGISIETKIGSKANDLYVISVCDANGLLLAKKTYTWIPTATSVSTLKDYADGTEAILSMSAAKVTYVSSDEKNVYIQDDIRGILAYNLGITGFEAYKQTEVNIWGIKNTDNTGVAKFVSCDSTAAASSVTPGITSVSPKEMTVSQTKIADNQLTYIKIPGAKIVKNGNNYYAVACTESVMLYDSFDKAPFTPLETVPCYADVTGILSINEGTVVVLPTAAIDNIKDKNSGTCGTVTWTIDLDGNMVFAPTKGTIGTLSPLGVRASNRPWSSYVTAVKTVMFEPGVSTAADPSYMFRDMSNLESVDLTNLNTSVATTMKGFFQNCCSLKSIDMSGLNLAKVTNFNLTFDADTVLVNVNIGTNTLAAVTNFNCTFYSCKSLQKLEFGNVPGTSVTDMAEMLYNCISLESVDFRNFSTAKVSSASKAKNVFGTGDYAARPTTLRISKDFGKTAVSDTYVALPAVDYMSDFNNEQVFKLATGNHDSEQSRLYIYNAYFGDYGTYVKYSPTTSVEKVDNNEQHNSCSTAYNLAGQRVNDDAKGVVIMNGRKYINK